MCVRVCVRACESACVCACACAHVVVCVAVFPSPFLRSFSTRLMRSCVFVLSSFGLLLLTFVLEVLLHARFLVYFCSDLYVVRCLLVSWSVLFAALFFYSLPRGAKLHMAVIKVYRNFDTVVSSQTKTRKKKIFIVTFVVHPQLINSAPSVPFILHLSLAMDL